MTSPGAGPQRSGSSRAVADPSAQPERTYQAWSRTALALTACALLATRLTPGAGVAAVAVAVLGGVGAIGAMAVQRTRLRSGRVAPAPMAVATLTALTVLLAGAALTLVGLRAA